MPHYAKHIVAFKFNREFQQGQLTYYLWRMSYIDGTSDEALFIEAHHNYILTIQDNPPELELDHMHVHIDSLDYNLITEITIPSSRYNVESYAAEPVV